MSRTSYPNPVVDELSRRVARYPRIVRKLGTAERISNEEATRWLVEAMKFMAVADISDEAVAPSRIVDAAWHQFILFTRAYADYCECHLGHFIHHDPTGDGDGSAYQRTRDSIIRLFGGLDEEIWPPSAGADCKDKGNCKSDCTGDCSSK